MPHERVIAFYLPQFHPIPENDEWWGRGFTEWTNTAKARPLFPGHYQPHIPSELGFYDLRVPETRERQAILAKSFGIEGFCYYHYWFAGRQILERPLQEVVTSKEPNFPFCICWANESWSGVWHGAPKQILLEQTYPGIEDHRQHFEALLPAFRDERYVRVDGKPVFVIYKPNNIPDCSQVLAFWRQLAIDHGLKGIHFVGYFTHLGEKARHLGFDALLRVPEIKDREWLRNWKDPIRRLTYAVARRVGLPARYDYARWSRIHGAHNESMLCYPCVIHAWDNTPRSGRNGVVLTDSSPEKFGVALQAAIASAGRLPETERFVFLKSWNEWAEGNHLEPDLRYGDAYLQVVKAHLSC